ncbi:hypothetical protein K402DRAFT_398832, partial [Aulographum hederae CBS 113979]
MASATDIITYIGIPLAVLGVLPTLYTCLKSLLTLRTIRHTLRHNDCTAITRSSLLSGIIEIEIPRKSIAPLDRSDPLYFELRHGRYDEEKDGTLLGSRNRNGRSHLRGGTWTLLNWKEMTIGVKSYRLQYHDELSQPQAETVFESLIAFLLDRGAVPNPSGWHDLRSSGLWTPAGTKLLFGPRTSDACLWISTSDDSDGILSLAMAWENSWGVRGREALPPYWIRLTTPAGSLKERTQSENESKDEAEEQKRKDADCSSTVVQQNSAIRLRVSPQGVEDCYDESDPKQKIHPLHLHSHPGQMTASTLWFSSGCTALAAPSGSLWSFAIPPEVYHFSKRSSIPCGVLVLVGFLSDEDKVVPSWRSPYDDQREQIEKHMKFLDYSAKINAELRMPPAERQQAYQRRMEEERREMVKESMQRRVREEEKWAQELADALASQKMSVDVVVEAARKWLVEHGYAPRDAGVLTIVERILYEMVQSQEMAFTIAGFLDKWMGWSDGGGMGKLQFEELMEGKLQFAYAACVLGAIKEAAATPIGSVVSDLQECLRIWKKVRL